MGNLWKRSNPDSSMLPLIPQYICCYCKANWQSRHDVSWTEECQNAQGPRRCHLHDVDNACRLDMCTKAETWHPTLRDVTWNHGVHPTNCHTTSARSFSYRHCSTDVEHAVGRVANSYVCGCNRPNRSWVLCGFTICQENAQPQNSHRQRDWVCIANDHVKCNRASGVPIALSQIRPRIYSICKRFLRRKHKTSFRYKNSGSRSKRNTHGCRLNPLLSHQHFRQSRGGFLASRSKYEHPQRVIRSGKLVEEGQRLTHMNTVHEQLERSACMKLEQSHLQMLAHASRHGICQCTFSAKLSRGQLQHPREGRACQKWRLVRWRVICTEIPLENCSSWVSSRFYQWTCFCIQNCVLELKPKHKMKKAPQAILVHAVNGCGDNITLIAITVFEAQELCATVDIAEK